MGRSILVCDVNETNDCAGKKILRVSSLSHDENHKSYFIMTQSYMFLHDKLRLATVCPGDHVEILLKDNFDNSETIGEYTSIIFPKDYREAICACGINLVSDGYDVYCPSSACGVTLAARLGRLSEAKFFDGSTESDYLQFLTNDFTTARALTHDSEYLSKPFKFISDPKIWGKEFITIEEAILKKQSHVNLATFLVENEFSNFIDHDYTESHDHSLEFNNISRFFTLMHELVNQRDFQDTSQNDFIKTFIWSLGIQSLTPKHIEDMLVYEMCFDFPGSPFVPYALILTRPSEMVNQLGFHPLEAEAIYREVFKRKYELCDIFSEYSSYEIMQQEIFKNMLAQR